MLFLFHIHNRIIRLPRMQDNISEVILSAKPDPPAIRLHSNRICFHLPKRDIFQRSARNGHYSEPLSNNNPVNVSGVDELAFVIVYELKSQRDCYFGFAPCLPHLTSPCHILLLVPRLIVVLYVPPVLVPHRLRICKWMNRSGTSRLYLNLTINYEEGT